MSPRLQITARRPFGAWGKIIALWMVLAVVGIPATALAEEAPRVLILFSNDRLLPANQRFDKGIRQALDPQGNQTAVSFFSEFLDATRVTGYEREATFEDYLTRRYRWMPPQVLVALGPEALTFLRERKDTMFPGVPLLFGGARLERLAPETGSERLAGLPIAINLKPVAEALLEMRPETREVLLVHGAADLDRALRDTATRQLAELSDRVKVTDFPELPLDELKARLADLQKDQAILYLSYFQSPDGTAYTPARVAREIAEVSAVPIVGTYDTYIGSGVLGVSVSTFEDQGIALGKVIRRVLDGEKVENIGVLPALPPRLIVDDRQVKRWKIGSVPAAAERRFHEPTLWELYPVGTPVGISVVVLQGGLIGGLLWARGRQRRAEKELRLSEERFSGIFRGSPAAISILRQADGRIIDVNPVWESLTGVTRAEAVGQSILENGLVIEGDAEARLRLFLDSGKPLHDYEQELRTRDGDTRILSISTQPHTLHGEPCVIIVAKDVTGSRLEEDTRMELARTARLAMLGEMTASIAHEVNQPLGAILSNADAAEMLLERDEPPLDQVKLILADIRRDDFRASEVITRVRSLVSNREVERTHQDLNALILESLRQVTHEADRRGVTIEHEFAESLPMVQVDPVQIGQILLNLLINGMDAMKDTPVAERLLIVRSGRRNGDAVAVSVEDRGHGVPPDRLGRVFHSFFTTKEGGMGLGLALARSIAEAHGGAIYAENNPSAGATFHLILPVPPEEMP